MTLRDRVNKIYECTIAKLMFEGRVIGLRVKSFDCSSEDFVYYDFNVSIISDQEMKDRVNSIANKIPSIQMIAKDTSCFSQEELDGSITVKEFKDEANAIEVLKPVLDMLSSRL